MQRLDRFITKDGLGRWVSNGTVGSLLLVMIALPCLLTLPWSLDRYSLQQLTAEKSLALAPPTFSEPMGSDALGRSLLWRALLGGAVSLGIGVSAAILSLVIGVTWGSLAGYLGGRWDQMMMRLVDVLYGLPYVLLVVLIDLAAKPVMQHVFGFWIRSDQAAALADVTTLLLAIGGVSWLTMARVIRGQVLSLRSQPFIEAARALGLPTWRILLVHLLPNLIGPIVVYTTLTVPTAILQESFLSFLGIGVQAPLPSWGNLAADGLGQLHALAWPLSGIGTGGTRGTLGGTLGGALGGGGRWWLLVWPCLLLGLTLLGLNLLGESLRDRLDPKR